jgi:hypothetical protein
MSYPDYLSHTGQAGQAAHSGCRVSKGGKTLSSKQNPKTAKPGKTNLATRVLLAGLFQLPFVLLKHSF